MVDFEQLDVALGHRVKSDSNNDAYKCPFCHTDKYKLSINKTSGAWRCFLCERSGPHIYALLKALGLGVEMSTTRTLSQQVKDILYPESKKEETYGVVEIPNLVEDIEDHRPSLRYLVERRGIPLAVAKQYGVKHTIFQMNNNYLDGIYFPLLDSRGVKRGWYARSIEGRVHKISKGTNKQRIIWNYHKYPTTIVCEGILSALACYPNGQAILGKTPSKYQLDKLLELDYNHYYLCLDNDYFYTNIIWADILTGFGKRVSIIILPPEKDPNDIGIFKMQDEVLGAVPYERSPQALNFFLQFVKEKNLKYVHKHFGFKV